MQLGIAWAHHMPQDWERALDLEPRWTKFTADMGKGWEDFDNELVPYCEYCVEHGVRPVIDLRTGTISQFARSAPPYAWQWQHGRWSNEALFAGYANWTREVAQRLDSLCADYEVWAEAPCMHVGELFFEGSRYVELLRATHEALKSGKSDCRVWFGGHGVNADPSFWRFAMQQGATDIYDVNNLHPFMHDREWGKIEGLLETFFVTMREVEAMRGDPMRAIGMTEFGWPTHEDGSGVAFTSHVQDSVLSCSEEEQAVWLDRSLALFERNGVDCVIIDKLCDGEGEHWGLHCGLYRQDWTPKPAVEVFREWAAKA